MGLNVSEIFDKRCLLTSHTCIKTEYYKTLLLSWFNLITTKPDRFKDFIAENLFANPLFTTGNQTFDSEYNNWKEAEILSF